MSAGQRAPGPQFLKHNSDLSTYCLRLSHCFSVEKLNLVSAGCRLYSRVLSNYPWQSVEMRASDRWLLEDLSALAQFAVSNMCCAGYKCASRMNLPFADFFCIDVRFRG